MVDIRPEIRTYSLPNDHHIKEPGHFGDMKLYKWRSEGAFLYHRMNRAIIANVAPADKS
jgi:hypothetical protein